MDLSLCLHSSECRTLVVFKTKHDHVKRAGSPYCLHKHIVQFPSLNIHLFSSYHTKTHTSALYVDMETPLSPIRTLSAHLAPSTGAALLTAHLLVQTLQLHLQGLHQALLLHQFAVRSPQSLVVLLHLALHHLQLEQRRQ